MSKVVGCLRNNQSGLSGCRPLQDGLIEAYAAYFYAGLGQSSGHPACFSEREAFLAIDYAGDENQVDGSNGSI